MAAADNLLFAVDTIVVDGKPVAFVSGTATLEGAHRYEWSAVPSGTGNDAAARKRVPTLIKMQLQFTNAVDPAALAKQMDVQIALRDTQSGRRAMLSHCAFASMGPIGAGPVDVAYNVLAPVQWL